VDYMLKCIRCVLPLGPSNSSSQPPVNWCSNSSSSDSCRTTDATSVSSNSTPYCSRHTLTRNP
jgi:hypothetical protein